MVRQFIQEMVDGDTLDNAYMVAEQTDFARIGTEACICWWN
ncbi:MAG: hypothetical protein U0903_05655 [Planctomycetales bacterium]